MWKSLAYDKSLRSIDADGHMRVEESRISKANVCPYRGSEIPGWQALGLNPDRIYRLLRDPKELEKAAPTFEGKPLLIRHVPIDAEAPRRELWVGTIGQVCWEPPYLVARPLTVLTAEAIKLIEDGEQRELSAAYRYDPVMTPGVWGGEQYDGVMTNIRGNHVAIVSEGRAGPDVHVADEKPVEFRAMKNADLIKRLQPYLKSDADLMALDEELGETPAKSVISLHGKDEDLSDEERKAAEDAALEEKRKEHGEDAELDDEEREEAYKRARDRKAKDKKARDKKARDAKRAKDKRAKDAAARHVSQNMDEREDEEDEEAEDAAADPEDHRRDFRSGDSKHGEDSVTKDELNAAVKAAAELARKQARELAAAREAVRPIVGAVSMALDSADEVYKYALKTAGVKIAGVHPSAFPALLELAIANRRSPAPADMALDAAGDALDLDSLFPPARAA